MRGLRACLLAMLIVAPRAHAGTELGTRARCARFSGLPAGDGTVRVAGGSFVPGSQHGYAEERGDGRAVEVASFEIDRTEVTNAQFSKFVRATGYVTEAERAGSAPVFHVPSQAELEERSYAWWTQVEGASWRHPRGPGSKAQPNHPVVQVTHADALAYARWLGHALPTEVQWEYAAKAGRTDDALHHEPRDASGHPTANFWQGDFPLQNALEDGFAEHAPVGCFEPNAFGLHDMLGNVWEWTSNTYTASHTEEGCAPSSEGLTIKGGSFLCAANFCARYRVAARHLQEPTQPAMHLGFRTVRNARD
ncbi:MAG TPA: formylglycine-generating enzyme family protein [Polyangiales bacterium]|nr:formylglycine-generating enzyme family protein [Polyangiales bacterium]